MPGEVEETAEAVPGAGRVALGPGAAVIPVGPVAVEGAVALPTTGQRSLCNGHHRSG
jgi:hypothetical protein